MNLRWYGTAAVVLESEGYRIAFDPFLGFPLHEDADRRALMTGAFRSADAVLVTHGHLDHIHDIPELFGDTDIPVYATQTPCATLMKLGVDKDQLRLIAPGDTLRIGSFTIKVYQGRHCRFDFAVMCKTVFKKQTLLHPLRLISLLRTHKAFPENGETLFYEIEAEGTRVQLMGSMGMDPDASYPENADVLILPFQGTGDPAKTVRPIIERLQPRSICLDHYDDTFPPMSSEIPTKGFAESMSVSGIPTQALRFAEIYDISALKTEKGN